MTRSSLTSSLVAAAILAGGLTASRPAAAERWAYVANRDGNSVSIVDVDAAVVRHTVPVRGPRGLAVHPDGKTVYVAAWNANTVVAIDVATRATQHLAQVVAGPQDVAVHPDGARAFVASRPDQLLGIFDPTGATPPRAIALAVAGGLHVALSPDGARAYVAHHNGEVSVVDVSVPGREALVRTLTDVAEDPTGLVGVFVDHVLVASQVDNRVVSVDTRLDRRLVARSGGSPGGLAVRGDGWAAVSPLVRVALRADATLRTLFTGAVDAVGAAPLDVAWSEGDPDDPDDDVWISADAGDDTATLVGPAGAIAVAVGEVPATVAAGPTVELPRFLRLGAARLGFAATLGRMAQRELIITNAGSAGLRIDKLVWSGAAGAAFAVADDPCSGKTLAPKASCRLIVTYRPSGDDRDEAALGVASSDPAAPLTWVALAGVLARD